MKLSKEEWFMYPFGIICAATTVSLCLYWCYEFSLNKDVTVVRYRKFYDHKDDVFPTMSLCLGNPFSEKRLSKYGVNITSYLAFLEGKMFDKEMLNIDYNYVKTDIMKYIKRYRIYFRNNTYAEFESSLALQENKMVIFDSYSGFSGYYGVFFKCVALRIPNNKDLSIFRILFSNQLFPNGVRPEYLYLSTYVHLPKQFLLSEYTEKWNWPYRSKNEKYKMRIILEEVDIVTQRDKKEKPCNEYWKEYDDWVIKRYKNKIGCTTPYHEQEKHLPMCSTQEQMKVSAIPLNRVIAEREEYIKPCKTMENVRIRYIETNMGYAKNNSFGEFWFSIGYQLHKFKKIDQARYTILSRTLVTLVILNFIVFMKIIGNSIVNNLFGFSGRWTSTH